MEYSESLNPTTNTRRLRIAQGLVLLFHVTGFVGLAFSKDPDFYLRFTPLTLLLTAGLLLAFQPQRGFGFWGFCVSVMVLGFAVEFIGVNTGKIFGHYTYGDTLGFKLFNAPPFVGVPPMIGLNWLVLTYVCGVLARYLPLGELPRILLAALLMVGLDVCLEPVAGRYDFWHWSAEIIPLQNFRDWFIVACVLQMLFNRANFPKVNALAPMVYLTQLLFFFFLGALQ
ncbi:MULTISPECIES: carotenoid biosynthesis protein [Hymenobacter]|uniref:Carotenoid biosynthesis protein n=1 Tax=Hymenobacter armeniacus TaxID=2771358 RepID=A0ABR8JXV9_9BACT|nr:MULTISPECIES: carotenoid biosynthesis protein [Hymenobacter]MBD2723392.1 carotenoid biosynthesis protein [Hymenobacter armeniacus]MBJ6107406.1 carotenoid biosynthesis protein [Hymenobacter sp. BT523]